MHAIIPDLRSAGVVVDTPEAGDIANHLLKYCGPHGNMICTYIGEVAVRGNTKYHPPRFDVHFS